MRNPVRAPDPDALRRTLDLVTAPPADPDAARGYLDLLDGQPAESTGRVQSLWLSQPGSQLYDGVIALGSALDTRWESLTGRRMWELLNVAARLRLDGGETVLDVGSGPGNITRRLAATVGDSGLVLGLDVSPAMLERAVRSTDHRAVVYLRGDAGNLRLCDGCIDAVCCSLALHLLPDPFGAIAEMARVLVPGGRIALAAPGSGRDPTRFVDEVAGQWGGMRMFRQGELADALRGHGFVDVRDRANLAFQFIDGRKRAPSGAG